MKAGDVRSRTQPVVQPYSGDIDGDENGLSRGFFKLNRHRSGRFTATMTAGIQLTSFKIQIGTKLDR
uniref:Uncharacterized protein n=1 Tax=Citrus limon TaxID=2708 RepID=A0A1S8ABV5_CITLI